MDAGLGAREAGPRAGPFIPPRSITETIDSRDGWPHEGDVWCDGSRVISRLQQEGRLPTPLPADMRYSGGIIGGIEFWGPVGGWAEVELRDHEIWTY